MKNYYNLVEVTKLINENLNTLNELNKEKEALIEIYNKDRTNLNTLKKIEELTEKYKLCLNEAKELNAISKKLKK